MQKPVTGPAQLAHVYCWKVMFFRQCRRQFNSYFYLSRRLVTNPVGKPTCRFSAVLSLLKKMWKTLYLKTVPMKQETKRVPEWYMKTHRILEKYFHFSFKRGAVKKEVPPNLIFWCLVYKISANVSIRRCQQSLSCVQFLLQFLIA